MATASAAAGLRSWFRTTCSPITDLATAICRFCTVSMASSAAVITRFFATPVCAICAAVNFRGFTYEEATLARPTAICVGRFTT